MKVLQVHNFYKQAGGEDIVLKKEQELLCENDVSVQQFIKYNTELRNKWDLFFAGLNTRYSIKSFNEFDSKLKTENPDIVHVHNFFPLITPSIFDSTMKRCVPSVMTLHNYRLIHPNGFMIHEGEIDERSLKGSAYRCVLDGVYRNSVIQTAIVANMIEYHRRKKTWQNKVDAFIALTDFAKNKFIEGGLPENKIYVKPNFVDDPLQKFPFLKSNNNREGFLFIGRISEEKGIRTLINTWMKFEKPPILTIIGDGPLKEELSLVTNRNESVQWLGKINNENVYKWLRKVKALVFPSTWYEGFPMTILEALSTGCPIITSDIGSQKSIVDDGISGLHFNVKDEEDLKYKVEMLNSDENLAKNLSSQARETYLRYYTPDINYDRLMKIYDKISN